MPHTWHDALDPRKIRSSADISIHMPHTCHIRGMTNSGCSSILVLNISIHMPHTWHDYAAWADAVRKIISIHMPHTWHDVTEKSSTVTGMLFQSTCHIRGMTCRSVSSALLVFPFQSTCHIRGMTRPARAAAARHRDFNPHATYVA